MTTITIEQSLLEQAVESFIGYRREMRLILGDEESEPCDAEKALRAALAAPATAPERKPMPILEVNARWEQSVLDIPRLQYYQVVCEVEAFHGIKEDKP